jgi:catechol 2,3-dioxygenase-like lactoylglutathione lyase family enzyme
MLGAHDIIAFVATTNAQLSREFYEQKLGLKFVSDDGFALVFEANGNMLRVVKLKEFTPAQFTLLGWEVPDAKNAVSELQSRGVQFERYP